MSTSLTRKLIKAAQNLPNLFQGHNIYVNRDKLRLIDHTFTSLVPEASAFADLGGVWKVNAAYAIHSLRCPSVRRGVVVDTDFPAGVEKKLRRYPNLQIVHADFGSSEAIAAVGHVDVLLFFDVLLHQANPDWDKILSAYAQIAPCFVIYNQQYILEEKTIRLTDLLLERYMALTSDIRADLYAYVYEHKGELHPTYQKPWGDIHNISQWGITDRDLRETMRELGYSEIYYRNHGKFLNLPAFENHAFIFRRT